MQYTSSNYIVSKLYNIGPASGMCVWKAELPATPADSKTVYTITVSSDKYGQASISNVMFGDVWICSGQSNMAFTVQGVS